MFERTLTGVSLPLPASKAYGSRVRAVFLSFAKALVAWVALAGRLSQAEPLSIPSTLKVDDFFLIKSSNGEKGILIETFQNRVTALHVGVIHDYYLVREDNRIELEVPDCVNILEGPPGGIASWP